MLILVLVECVECTPFYYKQPLVPYKVVKKGIPQPKGIVLRYGLHFMLMPKATNASSTVALDNVFNTTEVPQAYNDELAAVSDNSSQTASDERGIGPLSVKNIEFKYSTGTNGKESILGIHLDAAAKIGPVEFALLGLTLGLNFKSNKGSFTLHKLPPVDVSLGGLQAGFQKPPIEIAAAEVSYAGALVISYLPWRFQAAGLYGVVRKGSKTTETMKTFFLYCLLQGPLITFEFASIEGVCGGFRYNSNLKFPTPKNVMQFPLINGSKDAPASKPTDNILNRLLASTWFSPKDGSLWVAAGLTVKAFEILNVQAVLVIQWES
ncbi:hypothetical protein ASPBRDRAFT_251204 [Aspergillus brasiliensis CBS 101740]|uniref:DUF6603 domain-containing protein n=1 Tax=Aspergillus brasiliensis (strain CBS 101740 / IMI 381727 / IBT 21946) TaxID=767769 RepID=A0A1L9V222_ASPBC|nr:hypothetical protein ASPBRDRAFT_251204 [Aspergillus brasiliensis CBS 101740]